MRIWNLLQGVVSEEGSRNSIHWRRRFVWSPNYYDIIEITAISMQIGRCSIRASRIIYGIKITGTSFRNSKTNWISNDDLCCLIRKRQTIYRVSLQKSTQPHYMVIRDDGKGVYCGCREASKLKQCRDEFPRTYCMLTRRKHESELVRYERPEEEGYVFIRN